MSDTFNEHLNGHTLTDYFCRLQPSHSIQDQFYKLSPLVISHLDTMIPKLPFKRKLKFLSAENVVKLNTSSPCHNLYDISQLIKYAITSM